MSPKIARRRTHLAFMVLVLLAATASPALAGATTASTPTGVPTGVTATAGSASIHLVWQAPAATPPGLSTDGYYVYRATASGGPYLFPLHDFPVTQTEWVDRTAIPGKTYYYVVRTQFGNHTESGPSNEVSAAVAGGTSAVPTGRRVVQVTLDQTTAYVNGEPRTLSQPPTLVNGRTLVPFRFIGEACGATVEWNGETRQVTARYGDTTLVMTLNVQVAYINGQPAELDVPPQLVNGSTMLPLRFFAFAFGWGTDWDLATRTATVTAGSDDVSSPPGTGDDDAETDTGASTAPTVVTGAGGFAYVVPGGIPDLDAAGGDLMPVLVPGAAPLTGTISADNPIHWYVIHAQPNQHYTVETSITTTGLDTYLEAWAPGDILVGVNDNALRNALWSRVSFIAPTAGDYLISVQPSFDETGSYTVKCVAQPVTIPTLTVNGAATSGQLGVTRNDEWFRLQATAGQAYSITATPSNAEYPPYLWLHDGFMAELTTSDRSGSNAPCIVWKCPASGTYYLRVGSENPALTGSFSLSARTVNLAGALPLGASVTGTFTSDLQEQWYRMTVSAGSMYTFTARGDAPAGQTACLPAIGVFDSDLELLTAGWNFLGVTAMLDTTGHEDGWTEEIYVRLSPWFAGRVGSYRLDVSSVTIDMPGSDLSGTDVLPDWDLGLPDNELDVGVSPVSVEPGYGDPNGVGRYRFQFTPLPGITNYAIATCRLAPSTHTYIEVLEPDQDASDNESDSDAYYDPLAEGEYYGLYSSDNAEPAAVVVKTTSSQPHIVEVWGNRFSIYIEVPELLTVGGAPERAALLYNQHQRFYRFQVQSGRDYTITVSQDSGYIPQLHLFNQSGYLFGEVWGYLSFTAAYTGEYYLAVAPEDDGTEYQGWFSVEIDED